MELDIILEPDLTPDQIKELGLLAEANGFRGIWVQNYSSARDAFLSLAPLALATQKILIGVVIVCPYEMHPIKIANAVLTLNELSKGRAMAVVGSGGEWPEIMKSGVFHQPYGRRMTDVREALEIILGGIREKRINYEGQRFSALRFSTDWHTDSPPSVYHGACGPRMLAMGSRIADGIMMSDVMPCMLSKRLPAIAHARDDGRPRRSLRLSNFIAWHIRKNKERSQAEARRELIIRGWLDRDWLTPFLSPQESEFVLKNRWPFLKAWIEGHGDIEGVPEHVVDRLVEGLSLAGDHHDIERHTERLHKFAAAGFSEIALRVHEEADESIRLIAERVLPALR